MAGGIQIVRAIPGARTLAALLRDFARREGIVTAFSAPSLTACRALLDDTDPVTIMEFGKVVRELLVLTGEPAPLIASSGHILAAVGEACRKLPIDSPYERSSKFPGTHAALTNTLDELADYGCDRDALASALTGASIPLAAKLHSLISVIDERDTLLGHFNRMVSDRHLVACFDGIPELDGSFERLLVIAGDRMPPMKWKWLEWVAAQGIDVQVLIDWHPGDADLFEEVRLLPNGHTVGIGNQLLENLFAKRPATAPSQIEVQVVRAPDTMSECEWTLRAVHGLESAAIYVRNLESYAAILESTALRLGVPLQIWRRVPLLTNAYARLTVQVLEACRGNDVRRFAALLKSSYLGLSAADQETVLAALHDCYRRRDLQWEALEAWAAEAEAFPWMATILNWRRKARSGAYSLRDWMPILSELIRTDESLPWSTRGALADPGMRERDVRARNRMEQLMADHASVAQFADHRTYRLDQVVSLYVPLWEHADVSVPSAGEGVPVCGSAEMIPNVDTLFVMGMLEGIFPRRRSEDPVLSDEDRHELGTLTGLTLPNSHHKSRRERNEFYRVCAAGSNRLVFSYPEAVDDSDNIPAFYLEEAERASGGRFTRIVYRRSEWVPGSHVGDTDFDAAMREALEAPPEEPLPIELTEPLARAAILPEPSHRFSPAELQDSLQCPFRQVVRHRLGLRTKRPAARWFALQHLPEATQLPTQPDPERATSALKDALDVQLDAIYAEVEDWESQLLRSGAERLIRDWVLREFLARDKWPKEPGSIRASGQFGTLLRAEMSKDIAVRGSVPAVSEYGPYRVIHLFRGSVPENKQLSDADKLYYGIHMLGAFQAGRMDAVEVESQSGRRSLLVLGRTPEVKLWSLTQSGLNVIDLAEDDQPAHARRQFFDDVKKLLKRSVDQIRQGKIEAIPGDECRYCDYGELCRRSSQFSEVESLFGRVEDSDE